MVPNNTVAAHVRCLSYAPTLAPAQASCRTRRRPNSRRAAVVVRAAGEDGETTERTSWDFGRFVKTVVTFNPPPTPDQVVKSLSETVFGGPAPEPSALVKLKDGLADAVTEVVLVTGATGGVGKRVVERLVKKGRRVRALVRDVDKARTLFQTASGPGHLELAPADVVQPATLLPEFFTDVKQIVYCAAVTVGPKEGDTADRAKYSQGIKFYDPQIIGDTPEQVEFQGVTNILAAARDSVGMTAGKLLFGVGATNGKLVGERAWAPLDDVVMGGASQSVFSPAVVGAGEGGASCGVFSGTVTEANSGGFASVRTKNYSPKLDLSMYDGISLRLKGDGQRYKFIIRADADWDAIAYCLSFDTTPNVWQTVWLPFANFFPVFRASTVKDGKPLDPRSIYSMQLMLSKFEYDRKLNPSFRPGRFELPIAAITARMQEGPRPPRIVYLSSAGVTRCNRPGLDLTAEPPAVRMNDELGGIMTYKLKAEDAVRSAGVPFVVVRPTALTEEPAGAPLEFDQGDTIKGKISREDVADICVAALEVPAAEGVTFEVKSTVPFSEPWEGLADPGSVAVDYATEFGALVPGVTGKTVDGVYMGKSAPETLFSE